MTRRGTQRDDAPRGGRRLTRRGTPGVTTVPGTVVSVGGCARTLRAVRRQRSQIETCRMVMLTG